MRKGEKGPRNRGVGPAGGADDASANIREIIEVRDPTFATMST